MWIGRERRLCPPDGLHQLSCRYTLAVNGLWDDFARSIAKSAFLHPIPAHRRAGTAERTGGVPVLCLPDDLLRIDSHSIVIQTAVWNHRKRFKAGQTRTRLQRQDAIPGHFWPIPDLEATDQAAYALPPSRPDAGRAAELRRSRGLAVIEPLDSRHSGPNAVAPPDSARPPGRSPRSPPGSALQSRYSRHTLSAESVSGIADASPDTRSLAAPGSDVEFVRSPIRAMCLQTRYAAVD